VSKTEERVTSTLGGEGVVEETCGGPSTSNIQSRECGTEEAEMAGGSIQRLGSTSNIQSECLRLRRSHKSASESMMAFRIWVVLLFFQRRRRKLFFEYWMLSRAQKCYSVPAAPSRSRIRGIECWMLTAARNTSVPFIQSYLLPSSRSLVGYEESQIPGRALCQSVDCS
jgi:hypothetical protein